MLNAMREELIDSARKTLASEREQALAEAQRIALDLGAEFAQRLLAEVPMQFRAEAWIERIEQYIDALPKPERDALIQQLTDGQFSERLSRQQPSLRRRRTNGGSACAILLGKQIAIVFEVDPQLIAGAELHFPTAVLRFTWRNALAAARSEVGAHANTH